MGGVAGWSVLGGSGGRGEFRGLGAPGLQSDRGNADAVSADGSGRQEESDPRRAAEVNPDGPT